MPKRMFAELSSLANIQLEETKVRRGCNGLNQPAYINQKTFDDGNFCRECLMAAYARFFISAHFFIVFAAYVVLSFLDLKKTEFPKHNQQSSKPRNILWKNSVCATFCFTVCTKFYAPTPPFNLNYVIIWCQHHPMQSWNFWLHLGECTAHQIKSTAYDKQKLKFLLRWSERVF